MADHALRGEIHDMLDLLFFDQRHDLIKMMIEVVRKESERIVMTKPAIRQKNRIRLLRPASADDFRPFRQGMFAEPGSREGIAAKDKDFRGH